MLCIVIGILIGSIWGWIFSNSSAWSIGMLLGWVVAIALPMKTNIKHKTYTIENLQDNSTLSGNFFLGCGNVNGSMKYALYVKEKGMFKLMLLDVEDCKIKYSTNKPTLHHYEDDYLRLFQNWWAFDIKKGVCNYVIEVPKGTIHNNYTLDAK